MVVPSARFSVFILSLAVTLGAGALAGCKPKTAAQVPPPAPPQPVTDTDALTPYAPLITTQIQGAKLSQILEQIGADKGHFTLRPPADNFQYSLDVQDKTFWEVFGELRKQRPALCLMDGGADGQIGFFEFNNKSTIVNKGSVALSYRYWPEQRNSNGTTTAPRLDVTLAIDPRLNVVEAELKTEPIKDDAGNVLYTMPEMSEFAQRGNRNNVKNLLRTNYPLKLSPGQAPALPEVKLTAHVVCGSAMETAEVSDIAASLNKPIQLGQTTVVLTSFQENTQLFMGIDSHSSSISPYVIYEIYDKNNALARRWVWNGIENAGAPKTAAGGPYKLKVRAPQETKELTVDFDLTHVEAMP